MADIKKVISYLIPLIFLILVAMWLFVGSFPQLKERVGDVKKYISFGAEKELGPQPTIPEDHKKQIERLLKTMREMKESTVNNCFANYGGFSNLGEKGTSLHFIYDSLNDKTLVTVKGGSEGEQIVELEEGKGMIELPGVKLCVIGGGSVPSSFFNKVLKENYPRDTTPTSHFTEVSSIEVRFDTAGVGWDGNVIKTGLSNVDTNNNFQDGGWLFTPDNTHICFFPTRYDPGAGRNSCEAEEGGLQNSCTLDVTKLSSIPYLYGRGWLSECNPEKEYRWIEANLLRGSPGEGLVSGKCLNGRGCFAYGKSCFKKYLDADVGPSSNCRLLLTLEGDTCGYFAVPPGSKIQHQGERNELQKDLRYYGHDSDGNTETDLSNQMVNPNLKIVLASPDDPILTCGNNGLWNTRGLTETLFRSEVLFSPDACSDTTDNDGNGKVDCEDQSCSTNLACIAFVGDGSISKITCFDSLDNENVMKETEVIVENTPGKIDCLDPICEGIEYKDQKCVGGEVIALMT
ncbi:hypothetical protein HY496_01405 [Candidatus Woesearchaeota archaeon]|nr:hypothetical protein [Candidatus Woesearchaeota archaeon]